MTLKVMNILLSCLLHLALAQCKVDRSGRDLWLSRLLASHFSQNIFFLGGPYCSAFSQPRILHQLALIFSTLTATGRGNVTFLSTCRAFSNLELDSTESGAVLEKSGAGKEWKSGIFWIWSWKRQHFQNLESGAGKDRIRAGFDRIGAK